MTVQHNVLARLQAWYSGHCTIYYPEIGDSVWDRVQIRNLDNPGWIFSVNLIGTPLDAKEFTDLREDTERDDQWLICAVSRPESSDEAGSVFVGNGGPNAL